MTYCERLSEQLAIVATIDPVSQGAAMVACDIFAMTNHRRALFVLSTGANPTGILVNIQENAAAAFTAGTATLLTRAATAVVGVNSQYLFEVSAGAMGHGMQYLRAQITPSGVAHLVSMVVFADVDRYKPASQFDLATVVAIQSTA